MPTTMPTTKTAAARSALTSMRNGMVPSRTITAPVRRVLRSRGLVTEVTRGYLQLTARGQGVDPSTFEA